MGWLDNLAQLHSLGLLDYARRPLEIDPAAQDFHAGGPGGILGGMKASLTPVAVPSKSLRPNADPRATEIQLRDANGVPHYRGEMTNEGNGLFGVGYVENLTQAFKGRAADLYKAMAAEAERQGGTLIAGMNANRLSSAVHDQLKEQGLASPFQFGDRTLLKITSQPQSIETDE